MSKARLVVTAVVVEKRSQAAVARDYGVSRQWVNVLVGRYRTGGEAALQPRSRRPHSSPHRISERLEDEIVELRKHLADSGLDAGADTIASHLRRRHGAAPAVSTIWRALDRRGFVAPQPHKRPRSSWVRFAAEQPNERWQADITHWELANGVEVEILDLLDDHSRLAVGCQARAVFKAADVVAGFHRAAAAYGPPASVLTDNGAVFTGSSRGGGWVALERELVGLGIALRHSRPYHPQTCGKVERFHQTLKKWLARQPPMDTVGDLQQQLEVFRDYYNTIRPHRAVARRTPQSVFDARPKAVPAGLGVVVPSHYRVRRDKIDPSGVITLRHNSRLHHIGLSRRHAGTRVLVLARDLDVRVLTEHGELLRELTLDPTRDYQRQG